MKQMKKKTNFRPTMKLFWTIIMNRVVCTLELTMMLMMKHEVVNLKKASQTRDTARDLA